MPPEHWVFAYGSLMWDPRVPVAETAVARVEGFQRRFCLRSIQYRGTREAPGLVLGLDPRGEGACSGVALRIEPEAWPEAIAEIRHRELSTEAYCETEVTLALADGRRVLGLAYVMRLDHWQYAGELTETEQAEIIARAHGGRGPNAEYLFNTVAHLDQLGLSDADLAGLAERVRVILAAARDG